MKEKHVWSAQVLDLLMEDLPEVYWGGGSQPLRPDESNQGILALGLAFPQKSKTNDQGN